MMLHKESLYGWGVYDIPMPRSAHDIFSDRRKKNVRFLTLDRRKRNRQQSALAFVSGFLTHDIPWFQIVLTTFFSLLALLFIFFMNNLIPDFPERKTPEPIDIMIKVIEDFNNVLPIHETSSLKEEDLNKKRLPPKSEAKPKPVVRPKLVERQKVISIMKKEQPFEEKLPDIIVRSKIEREPSSATMTLASENVSIDKITQPEEINISVPADQNHRYRKDSIKPTLREIIPQQSDSMPSLILKHPIEKTVVASLKHQKKSYSRGTITRVKVAPSVKAGAFMVRSDDPPDTFSPATLPRKDYKRETSSQTVAMNSGRTDLFLTHKDSQVSTITPASRTQNTYKRKIDPGSRSSVMPSVKGDLLMFQPEISTESVSLIDRIQRSYKPSAVRPDKISNPDNISGSKAFTADVSSASDEVYLAEPVQVAKQYSASANNTIYQSRALPGPTDQSQIFMPQNDSMSQEEDFQINSHAKSSSKPLRGNPTAVNVPAQSHNFLGNVSIDEIDSSQLISLKELAVCADPEEEFYLKTKLATLLGGPAKCDSNGMLFFFKYTESGYTIQVNIYNPMGAPLKDRCSVLCLAIECIENLRKKGVTP